MNPDNTINTLNIIDPISVNHLLNPVVNININKNLCKCNCACKNKNNYDYMCLAPSHSKKVIRSVNGDMMIKTINHCKHFASCELARTSCLISGTDQTDQIDQIEQTDQIDQIDQIAIH